MSSPTIRLLLRALFVSAFVFVALACAGGEAPVQGECCSVDDVIQLTAEGVSDELIIATLRTSGTDLPLSSADVVKLTTAGVSEEVIDVLNGGPCVCEDLPEPEPVVDAEPVTNAPAPEPTGPAPLKIAVKYNGGKNMEVVNLSKRDYTGLTLVVNDEYQYRLKKLKSNAADFVRLKSFISRRTGKEGNKIRMKKIVITADQGSFSRTF